MGYTHYWERRVGTGSAEQYGRLALGVLNICRVAEATYGIETADALGTLGSQPEFTEAYFAFNGADGGACESFFFRAKLDDVEIISNDWAFECTKTRGLPYDCVVTAALIRAKVIYGDNIRVSSDGYWEDNWSMGASLYELTFGEPATCPFDQVSA